jgi:hypothetical protein
VLIDRDNLPRHRRWIIFILIAVGCMIISYGMASKGLRNWPGGSSLVGFVFGILGSLIIIFECFLWVRKNLLRSWRIGRTQVWMRAHIWLGLLVLPLVILHSGFRLGGMLTTALMVLLITVIISGVWGLAVQQFLPRFVLDRLPAETVYSPIESVTQRLSDQARRLVDSICGADQSKESSSNGEMATSGRESYLTIGTLRTAGKVKRKVLQTRTPDIAARETEALRSFFQTTIDPYLRSHRGKNSPLRSPSQASRLFENLKARIPPEAHQAVDSLEELCEQRRNLATQSRAHFWLHCWLWVHLPLSAALLWLMCLHVFYAVKFW